MAETDPDIVLEQVQPDALDTLWPLLEPDLARACEGVRMGGTTARIKDAILAGEMTLWAIYDRRKPLPILGALTTCLKQVGDETAVSFSHLGGREMHRWLDLIVSRIETLGKEQGATISEIEGRMGWAAHMRSYGYRPARVVLHKEL